MAQVQTFQMAFRDFPRLQTCSTVIPSSWSIHYCIEFSILKVLIRSKSFVDIHESFKAKLNQLLDACVMNFQAPESSQHFQTFRTMIGHIDSQADPKQCHEWLDYWLCSDSLISVLYTSFYISSHLATEQGLSIDELLVSNPLRVVQNFSSSFGVYIQLVWKSGHFLYEAPSQGLGFLMFFYYNTESKMFGVLLQELDLVLEKQWTSEQQFIDQFLFRPAQLVIPEIDSQDPVMRVTAIHSDCPKLLNLLSVMAKTLVDNNLYSAEIEIALKSAIEATPDLSKLHILNSVLQLKSPFCTQHLNSKFIQLRCNNEHCSECIYSKIKAEYTKASSIIFCPCKVQISTKCIKEIKESEEFKEFFKRV